jgi:hypothetical protein
MNNQEIKEYIAMSWHDAKMQITPEIMIILPWDEFVKIAQNHMSRLAELNDILDKSN